MIVLAVLALVLALASPASARSWVWPVDGQVLTPFAVGADPFAGGQHRGVDLAAPAGGAVRAPCAGRVSFAGRVPGRGRAVTLRCGAWVATLLELGRVVVRRGDGVAAGAPVGAAAASHVQLGARRAGRRFGYVDPLRLLGPEPAPVLGPAPPVRHRPRARPWPRPGPRGAPARRPAPAPAPRGVPLVAWVGLGALAGGMPLGAVVVSRRRRACRVRRTSTAAG